MRILLQLLARELHFFKYGILRILGKWYTKPPAPKAPVPVTMMMVILLRNVDAIVGEKMKEKLYYVTMSHAKSNGFILNA